MVSGTYVIATSVCFIVEMLYTQTIKYFTAIDQHDFNNLLYCMYVIQVIISKSKRELRKKSAQT